MRLARDGPRIRILLNRKRPLPTKPRVMGEQSLADNSFLRLIREPKGSSSRTGPGLKASHTNFSRSLLRNFVGIGTTEHPRIATDSSAAKNCSSRLALLTLGFAKEYSLPGLASHASSRRPSISQLMSRTSFRAVVGPGTVSIPTYS